MAKSTPRTRRPASSQNDAADRDQDQPQTAAATAVEAPPAPAPRAERSAPPERQERQDRGDRSDRNESSGGGGGSVGEDVAGIDAETNAKYEQVKGGKLYIKDLQQMDILGLHEIARAEHIQDYIGLKKQDLIFQILRSRIRQNGLMYGEGVLEILPDGFWFQRSPEYNYLP